MESPFNEEYVSFRRTLLVSARRKASITQAELAERITRAGLDLTRSVVSKIERGERRLDVVEFIYLARALGCDPARVIAEAERAFPKRRKKP